MKKDYCPPRCEALLITTYGDVALVPSVSGSVPEEVQLSKPSFTGDEDDSEVSKSLWSDDDENNNK